MHFKPLPNTTETHRKYCPSFVADGSPNKQDDGSEDGVPAEDANSSDDDNTSSDEESEGDANTNNDGLSDYERLRLEQIARNHNWDSTKKKGNACFKCQTDEGGEYL